MRFQTHCKVAKGPVDPVPLVNVVFLLLIFLVLSSPLVLTPGIGMVDLPSSEKPPTASFQGMVVTVTRENLIFFNNQITSLDNLDKALHTAAHKFPRQELIIKADRQVPHGAVVQVMSMALNAGITAINWATRSDITPPSDRK
jgi:biopolymer transport protein ExbD